MEERSKVDRLIEELKESVEFLESLLTSESRLEFVAGHIEEVYETISATLSRNDLGKGAKEELEALLQRAEQVLVKSKELVEARNREYRNIKPKSRAWE